MSADTPAPATQADNDRFREAMLTAMAEYEHASAAARNSVPSSTLATLANDYAHATTGHARDMLAADVAEGISLAEAGTIRRAAKALELGMPGIICRARATGMEPNEIARQLGATGSYVRRILRDNRTMLTEASRARRAEQRATRSAVEQATDTRAGARPTNAERLADVAQDDNTSGHDWHHPTPSAGLVCRRCDLAHKNWSGNDCPATT